MSGVVSSRLCSDRSSFLNEIVIYWNQTTNEMIHIFVDLKCVVRSLIDVCNWNSVKTKILREKKNQKKSLNALKLRIRRNFHFILLKIALVCICTYAYIA